jgi:ribosomal protein S8
MKITYGTCLLTLKNGQQLRRAFILQTRKKFVSLLKNIMDEGFILGYKIDSENSDKIKIFLKYREGNLL